MKAKFNQMRLLIGVSVSLGLCLGSCTDLDIEETDSIIENQTGEFTGVSDVELAINASLGALTGQFGDQTDLYALNEVTSDELLVPTRGTDWSDNGQWRVLHQHNWNALDAYVLDVWNERNAEIFNTTEALDPLSNPSELQAAQLKFLRAYNMFWVMDMFGQVPFRSPSDGLDVLPTVFTRSEALDFVKKDLTEAIPVLPVSGPDLSKTNGFTRAAGQYLLAKVLLNAHIYNGTGTPNPSDLDQVVSLVDEIKAAGFDLQEGYFDIFKQDEDTETIWYLTAGVGNRIWNGLHYFQNVPTQVNGGWNGWCTLGEFYDKFEGPADTNAPNSGQEERRGFVPTDGSHFGIGYGFLIGQQYDANGVALKTRQGGDLNFTKELVGIIGNGDENGIRTIKYHPENGAFTSHQIHYRYSDAHLMKAEALFRNGDTGGALALINELREIRGATPFSSLTEDDILDERGRELWKEFWRRNDLIRFGKFDDTWELKDSTDPTRALFPIPATAVISNPNLTQNEGY